MNFENVLPKKYVIRQDVNGKDIETLQMESYNLAIDDCRRALEKNMPTAEEIEKVIYRTTITPEHNRISGKEISLEHQKEIAQAILTVIGGGKR